MTIANSATSGPERSLDAMPRAAAIAPSNALDLSHATVRLYVGGAGIVYVDMEGNSVSPTGSNATATGTVTMSGTNSGDSCTVVVNGTSVAFTAGLTDTASAVAAKTAINANSTVNLLVLASNVLGILTLTAKSSGLFGNVITTTVTGTGVTANQAALTGGTGGAGCYLPWTLAQGHHPIRVTKVYKLGTTATLLNAEW